MKNLPQFKVGDEVIVTRSYSITGKGSIGVIVRFDRNLIWVEFSKIMKGSLITKRKDMKYSVTVDGIRKLTKLDKALC